MENTEPFEQAPGGNEKPRREYGAPKVTRIELPEEATPVFHCSAIFSACEGKCGLTMAS